jgi:hypothetical protein
MLDWFDPGLSAEDFASMHTDLVTYARSRLAVGESARVMYEHVRGRSCRITLLRNGMSHTSFTDLKLLSARDQADREVAASNLQSINSIVLELLDKELKGKNESPSSSYEKRRDVVVQCFSKAKQKPRQ